MLTSLPLMMIFVWYLPTLASSGVRCVVIYRRFCRDVKFVDFATFCFPNQDSQSFAAFDDHTIVVLLCDKILCCIVHVPVGCKLPPIVLVHPVWDIDPVSVSMLSHIFLDIP